jgi:hypothetical protein
MPAACLLELFFLPVVGVAVSTNVAKRLIRKSFKQFLIDFHITNLSKRIDNEVDPQS